MSHLKTGAVDRQRLVLEAQQFGLSKKSDQKIEHAADVAGADDPLESTTQRVVVGNALQAKVGQHLRIVAQNFLGAA